MIRMRTISLLIVTALLLAGCAGINCGGSGGSGGHGGGACETGIRF